MKLQRGSSILALLLAAGLVSTGAPASDDKNAPKDKQSKPKPTNRLARETSPYLLMHAHNPVDWYPWGPEAFEKAKKENKLIFLSIGYSSCYWCHVMERQSFSNADVAKMLNANFVCVKVDREERPDVDNIYMTALNVQGQRGGWPLSMFLTPEGKPIGGGTYWPPDDREVEGDKPGEKVRLRGFKTILNLVQNDWQNQRDVLAKHADRLADAVSIELANTARVIVPVELNRALVKEVVDAVKENYDPEHGGFGSKEREWRGPKFPQPPMLELLLAEYRRTKDEALLKMVTHTLDRMAMGGIFDHLGGGFHRYSTDREWKVPHFEKMLYDNAQLLSVYSRAYRITGKPLYRRVVETTIGFVAREMTAPEGGFYSALDAETEAEEGRFYVWTTAEIDKLLPRADAERIKRFYGVDAGANFEEKYNVLLLPRFPADMAKELKISEDELIDKLKPVRDRLFQARSRRPRPFLDTKILTSWNGLMIAGHADAATALDFPGYARVAERAAEFILNNLKTRDGRLLRTYTARPDGKGEAKVNAFLEDYAGLVHGLLALHESTGNRRWLDEAKALTDAMITHHHDKKAGGFFFTAHDHEKLFARAKDQYDGVTPAGNSLAALNLVRLARKTGDQRYEQLAEETFKTFSGNLKAMPTTVTVLGQGLALWLDGRDQKPAGDPFSPLGSKHDPKKAQDLVKVTADLSPKQPDAEGKQKVTVTLDIAKGWHACANPTGNDLLSPTTVALSAKNKLQDVQIDYPAGTELKTPAAGMPIRVYEGKTTITAAFRRAMVNGKPDAGPIEITVKYQVCDDATCLPPKTVKLEVGGP